MLSVASVVARYLCDATVCFDRVKAINESETGGAVAVISCNAFSLGCHEWTLRVLRCDAERQEVGVVSNGDGAEQLFLDRAGAIQTAQFGARGILGMNPSDGANYYGSFNADGKARCLRELAGPQWAQGDVIRVCLNLNGQQHTFVFILPCLSAFLEAAFARIHVTGYLLSILIKSPRIFTKQWRSMEGL